MINQKDRKFYQLSEQDQEFSKSVHHWLAQYDEEDDFLCEKTLNLLPDITEQK